MPEVCWATPLYEFLRYCEESELPKTILDCGAGGDRPPLNLFHSFGYATAGIDADPEAVRKAAAFCERSGTDLRISEGDMRDIPFPDESFSFAYSYNAIFFLSKPDIAAAVSEMRRVLKPGGLCFVNLMSVDDPDRREFKDSYFVREILRNRRFSVHEDDEADTYFAGFTIVWKQKRTVEKLCEGEKVIQAYLDYIARKDRTG